MSRIGVVHVHSRASHDGRDALPALREFALARDLSFVGLTDHAEDLDAVRYAALVDECAELSDDRVALIPGLEYRFAGYPGLHLLALGLREWIAPATPEAFMRDTRDRAGFTIAAHPVLFDYILPEVVRDGIDAIEVWNAGYNTRYLPDPRAIRLLGAVRRVRPGVVGVAGLDQHDARNDRETRVVLLPDAPADPLAALKAGRFLNRGRTLTFGAQPAWGPAALALLTAARWGFDRFERTQERVSRWWQRRRRR